MRRREFIALIGCAASAPLLRPLPASAEQGPVIGYLGASSRNNDVRTLLAMREGLKESGFVEGQNVTVDYRWAEGRYDRLPALAEALVWRQVDVIFAPSSTPAALAAKAATATIPIVFTLGSDPVAAGLVASLAHPGGNATGVSILVNLLSAKRLEMLRTLVPGGIVCKQRRRAASNQTGTHRDFDYPDPIITALFRFRRTATSTRYRRREPRVGVHPST
jgi:putative ABC transport system substrate-binding protein